MGAQRDTLARRGYNAVGLDIAGNVIRRAKSRAQKLAIEVIFAEVELARREDLQRHIPFHCGELIGFLQVFGLVIRGLLTDDPLKIANFCPDNPHFCSKRQCRFWTKIVGDKNRFLVGIENGSAAQAADGLLNSEELICVER